MMSDRCPGCDRHTGRYCPHCAAADLPAQVKLSMAEILRALRSDAATAQHPVTRAARHSDVAQARALACRLASHVHAHVTALSRLLDELEQTTTTNPRQAA